MRRISRGSLAALSASQSHADSAADPLAHLEPLFTELADSFESLALNTAALNSIHANLNNFNEDFAAFLYGLKLNAYTTDFVEVRSAFPLLLKTRTDTYVGTNQVKL